MPSRTARKLSDIAFKYSIKLRRLIGTSVRHQYEDFSILLPANHGLPIIQRKNLQYDRFLPHLAKYIKADETIFDIGANVGDTLAGMAEQNSHSTYICIEPDDEFFQYLLKNISRIKAAKKNLNVHAVKSLVGKNVTGISLEGHGGTKHAVITNEGKISSRPLDDIISDLANISNVRIIKTDVDGFDYDVIDSSLTAIRKYKPMIFLECQCDYDYQKSGYGKTFATLESEGYRDWIVFDNFGQFMLRTSHLNIVTQLLDYVWHQNIGNATRTIFYFDVLAAQGKDRDLIDSALATYQ